MFIGQRLVYWNGFQRRQYLGRFYTSFLDFFVIQLCDFVNELPITFILGIKVMAKSTINKNADNVIEGEKHVEMKVLD